MALLSGTLIANKDAAPMGYASLLLAQFVFADGASLYCSTHNLNAAEGGTAYGGHSYLARIAEQDLAEIQARSEQGIDRIADVTLHLYNADQELWQNWESAAGRGFKGAILYLALILMDIDPATGGYVFTSDSPAPLKFCGICDAPNFENGGALLTVRATTSHNLARVDFPILHVEQRCINYFPATAAQRAQAHSDMSSWWYDCGYCPEQGEGTGSFTSCQYTKGDCIARGMWALGRYKGIQWAPANRTQQSKSYTQGKTVTVFSSRNDSIYDRSYPMLYGTQWIKRPIIANVIGDANSTRMEVVLCVGEIAPYSIQQVVVNGVIVPPLGYTNADKLFRWNFLDAKVWDSTHTGSRNGYATLDYGYNGNGDPYGGLATIEIVVYAELAQSNSVPDVKVLLSGPKIKCPDTADPDDQASWPYEASTQPPWVLLDVLVWGNYSYGELGLQSFIDAVAVCSGAVGYTDPFGNSRTHNRYICELGIEDRRKGNEVVQALLRSFCAQLVPNSETGKLDLLIRQSLADQQPAPIAGSNYNTAIASVHADGSAGNGYVAALIDESIIQKQEQPDGQVTPKIRGPYSMANAQAANRISFPFQDSENSYADDSISMADPDDIARAAGYQLGGATIDAGISLLGISNFDQAARVSNTLLAENLRGNENGDTRGTRFWDVETTHRLEHLRVGQIVLFRYQAMAIDTLARVEKIRATANYRRMTITLRQHVCGWYTDEYGQHATPPMSDPGKSLPARPPYPWKPYSEQPVTGDSLWDTSEWNFGLAQAYELAADGSPLAKLTITGCPPVNQFSQDLQPPVIGLGQGTTAPTGGTIPGGQRIMFALAAKDDYGYWTPLSNFGYVDIPTGTDTNTAITPTLNWRSGTQAFVLFAGTSEASLCAQQAVGQGGFVGSGTPSTLTITSLSLRTFGPPDALADSLSFPVTRVYHGGVWGDACGAVDENQLTFGTDVTNDFTGYDLTLLANPLGSSSPIGIMDFEVTGNTGGVYTVTPDPVAAGVLPGAVFEMRARANIHSATTIGDSNFVTLYAAGGLDTDVEIGRRVRIIAGTGRGQERAITGNTGTTLTVDQPWDTEPDSTSRFIVVDATDQPASRAYQSAVDFEPSPAPTVATLNVNNYRQQVVMIEAVTNDQNGKTALDVFCPRREVYVWGVQGTRTVGESGTMLPTDGTLLFDTSGVTGSTDTLAADITDTTGTSITLTSGAGTVNGTVISVGTERMFIVSGGGTANLVVERGFDETTAATHSSGATVNLPGELTFTLLPIDQLPNVPLVLSKISTDIHFVRYQAATGDELPGGGTSGILPDNSAGRGTIMLKAPGA